MPETADKIAPRQAEVEIEKLVYGGSGLARMDGQVVLIPYVLPGERVSVSTERVNSGALRGTALEVVQASHERVVPRCEYFGTCGGCHYQHANYALQLEQKRQILLETLQRIGGISYGDQVGVVSGEPWFYRNRIQLHCNGSAIGFHKAGTHELCAIDHCYISSPVLVDVIAKLQAAAKEPQWPTFLRSLEVFTNGTEVQLTVTDSLKPVAARFFEWCRTFLPASASGAIDYSTAHATYRISRGSFFQVNRFLVDQLVEEVMRDSKGKSAVDLYAGVGLFSVPLAEKFERVEAVERGAAAYRDLEWNAKQKGRIRTRKIAAEEFLRELKDIPDLIVADPPRAGLGKDATRELRRIKAPRLILVSCDIATLARDAKSLLEDYDITRLTLVDLFPQTYHFEAVVHLEKR